VKTIFKEPGNFELKTGRDDIEQDFGFRPEEECHVLEMVMGRLPVMEEWAPPAEGPDSPHETEANQEDETIS
jgi:hypothetical protein